MQVSFTYNGKKADDTVTMYRSDDVDGSGRESTMFDNAPFNVVVGKDTMYLAEFSAAQAHKSVQIFTKGVDM